MTLPPLREPLVFYGPGAIRFRPAENEWRETGLSYTLLAPNSPAALALAASWLPARRAAALDPAVALKDDG